MIGIGRKKVSIYLDAVWALNFFIDLMLLMLTGVISKVTISKRRLMAGAFIASLIVPLSIYYPDTILTSVIGKLGYSGLIIICAFGYTTIYRSLKLLMWFYFLSFATGGGLIGLHYMLQQPMGISGAGFLTVNQGYGDPVSWMFIMIGFPCVWLFTKKRMDKHAIEKIRYEQLYEVTLSMKNKSYMTDGYIDSGNQLVCPLTKKPVIIGDELFLKQWFTDQEWNELKEAQEHMSFEKIPTDWEGHIHIVPYQGVSGNSQFLLALRPEKLVIHYNNEDIVTDKVLVGIQFASLTKDHKYHCLLHPQIIKLSAVKTA